ncbi:MAG: 16S rRNA (uracil(1498)-N(3))-methyltransferase, partial [Bacteroidales bacterium]|nr:16S rRNA (uracil(1498)-N(3))-methyltransferase [Bacteroidales bacterium]
MHLFYTPDIAKSNELPEEEAAHALRVLRLGVGDELTLTDGQGMFFQASITAAANKRCQVSIQNATTWEKPWNGYIHLAMAPTKNIDRMEWLAEKATEIGLDELTFLDCRYSERRVVKTERIDKILVSAMKQSLKAVKPRLNDMIGFQKFVQMPFEGDKYIAHCNEGEKLQLKDIRGIGSKTLVLIGPEGDFSTEEVAFALENGFKPVSLGKSRLRTETAALVATHIINLKYQNP